MGNINSFFFFLAFYDILAKIGTFVDTFGAKRPALLGAKCPCAWVFYATVLSVGILQQIFDNCGNGYLKFNIYEWHGNAANQIFWQTLIESLASIHDIIQVICGQCFEMRRKVSWGNHGNTPMGLSPRVKSIAIPHNKLQCTLWDCHIYSS